MALRPGNAAVSVEPAGSTWPDGLVAIHYLAPAQGATRPAAGGADNTCRTRPTRRVADWQPAGRNSCIRLGIGLVCHASKAGVAYQIQIGVQDLDPEPATYAALARSWHRQWYHTIMATRTILVVDDEPGIVTIARDYLDRAGFRVLTAAEGNTALRLARSERPSLMVLDLMLPGMDGLDITRALRQDPATRKLPIIMLTARVEETDRLIGLELGADDYIAKPFSPRELVARVRAVLRRSEGESTSTAILQHGALSIDLERRSVRRDGTLIDLTATEFDLLAILAREPGRPFTRAQLLELAYDVSYAGYDRTVDAHIKNLRRKIEADPRNPKHILTIYGVGYRFAEEE